MKNPLRLYCVADIHGKPERFQAIATQVAALKPDCLIVAGDICQWRKPEKAVAALADFQVPVLAICGNSDPARINPLLDQQPGVTNINMKMLSIHGISFVGVGGCLPLPFHSSIGMKEPSILEQVANLMTSESVLICHPPPYGVGDQVFGKWHSGSRRLAQFIRNIQPLLVICGHVHESAGYGRLGNTVVVNCSMGKNGAGALIQLEPDTPPMVDILQ